MKIYTKIDNHAQVSNLENNFPVKKSNPAYT